MLCAASLFPLELAAQDQSDTPETAQVALAGFTLEHALIKSGVRLLDEAGTPVMQRIALDDSVIAPVDQVSHAIAREEPPEVPAMKLTELSPAKKLSVECSATECRAEIILVSYGYPLIPFPGRGALSVC